MPHHVRDRTESGTGIKPDDRWAVPLCGLGHHVEGHQSGWQTFEAKYGVDLRQLAEDLADRSPHIRKVANG